MNSDKTETLVPQTIGTPFEGGFYGGQIRIGIVLFAIAWAPKSGGEVEGLWLPNYTSVPNATSCFDSMANTKAMAEAGSPIAQQALAAEIAGHKDWCIPARDVLELGYRNLKPGTYANACSFRDGDNASSVPPGYLYTDQSPVQTEVEAFRKGGAEAFEERWYWSSTQSSEDHAFIQSFYHGRQSSNNKKFEARARFVRLIQLNA